MTIQYKMVVSPSTDSDPPTSSIETFDKIIGIDPPAVLIKDLPTPYDSLAVGDGITDDTEALQAWLDRIEGGAGYLATGTFLVSNGLIIHRNTTIYGAGSGAAIIGKLPGFPPSVPLLRNANPLGSATPVDSNIFIYNICIQGSQTDQCSANLIDLVGVINVVFRNCILRFHQNADAANSYLCGMSNASDVWFVDNIMYGFGFLAATGPNGGGALWTNYGTSRIHIVNNTFRDGTCPIVFFSAYGEIRGNGMFNIMEAGIFGVPSFSQIVNNRISSVRRQNSSGHGMEIAGDSVVVDGNVIDSTDGSSIHVSGGQLYTVTNNVCRASWLNRPVEEVHAGSIVFLSLAGVNPGYLTCCNNICSLGPAAIPSGILFANLGGLAMNNVLCSGNMLAGTLWSVAAIDFFPDYTSCAGTNFMVRDNLGAADADFSTQTINFAIPQGSTGGLNVGGVGFKASWIQFQAVLSFTGTCAVSIGQQSWETGWDIPSQVITTARSYFTATGVWWATDGTDCASGDSAGRSSITVRDELGHPICLAGVTALTDDGFVLTINGAISAEINNDGSGYAVGDTGTINGGTTQATYLVLAVSGGNVTALAVNGGAGYTNGTGVATTTGGSQPGSGTGLTVNTFAADPTTQEVIVNAICHA